MSFDIIFMGQGFEKVVESQGMPGASLLIQHEFSKRSLVNLASKDANLVFYLSVYKLFHSSNERL